MQYGNRTGRIGRHARESGIPTNHGRKKRKGRQTDLRKRIKQKTNEHIDKEIVERSEVKNKND